MPRTALMATLVGALLPFAAPAAAQDGDAMVIVNGKPISRQRIVDLLIESHGVEIMQQLVVLELAREECKARGLRVAQPDIDAEYRSAVDKLLSAVPGGAQLDEAGRRAALQSVLDTRGLSMAEFDLGMERNAYLRKICEAELQLSEDDLKSEFGRAYGAKLRTRFILLADATAVREAVEALNSGADFADVARRLSSDALTAPNGGALPPFSADEEVLPPAVREAAFLLRDGEVSSAIRIDNQFYIIKVEGRDAPQNVKYEDVREVLIARIKDRVLPRRMSELAAELFKKAKIRVIDARLKRQYDELIKKNAAGG